MYALLHTQLDAHIYACMYAPDGLNEAVLRVYVVGPQLRRHQLRRQELRRYAVRRYEVRRDAVRRYEVRRYAATEVGCGT